MKEKSDMYVDLGDGKIVSGKNIIGFFNNNSVKFNNEDKNEKTVVVTKNGNIYSNISTNTIEKRVNKLVIK